MPMPADIISAEEERQFFPQHDLLNPFDSANCCIFSQGTLVDLEIGKKYAKQGSLPQLLFLNNL